MSGSFKRGVVLASVLLSMLAGSAVANAAEVVEAGSSALVGELTEAARRFSLAQEAEMRARVTPQAQQDRAQSATEHADESGAEAAQTLESELGDEVSLEPSAPLADVAAVPEFVSPTSARVVDPRTGQRLIAASTSPLWTEAASGSVEPIDLKLEPSADRQAFEPVASSTLVSVPIDLSNGIRFGASGVGLFLRGSAPAQAMLKDGRAFFPNVLDDTDLVVLATDDGVETFTQLRSRAAPERHTFQLDLPDGGRLVAQSDGGVLMEVNGQAIGRIHAPSAVAADGQNINVRYDVEGSALTLVVEHQGTDVAYPILVDPVFDDFGGADSSRAWFGGSTAGLSKFLPSVRGPAGYRPIKVTKNSKTHPSLPNWSFNNTTGTNGLYAYTDQASVEVRGPDSTNPGTAGLWTYDIPTNFTNPVYGNNDGPCSNDAYMTKATFRYVGLEHNNDYYGTAQAHMGLVSLKDSKETLTGLKILGGLNDAGSGYIAEQDRTPYDANGDYLIENRDGGQNTKAAAAAIRQCTKRLVFGLVADPRYPGAYTDYVNAYLGGVVVYYTDPNAPLVNAQVYTTAGARVTAPMAWSKAPSWTATSYAVDRGLGVKRVGWYRSRLPRNNGAAPAVNATSDYIGGHAMSCTVSFEAICPSGSTDENVDDPADADPYNATAFPGEGVWYIRARGDDPLGLADNDSRHYTWANADRDAVVRYDKSAPLITRSGELGGGRSSYDAADDYTLKVSATDGSVADNASRRSGVASVSAALIGPAPSQASRPIGTTSAACATDSCPLTLDRTGTSSATADDDPIDLAGFASGTYTLRITANDLSSPTNTAISDKTITIQNDLTQTVVENFYDPTGGNWKANPNLDFTGWTKQNDTSNTSALDTKNEGNPATNGLFAKLATELLGSGSVEWRFKAPGASTIYRADYDSPEYDGAGCLTEGLRKADNSWQQTSNAQPGGELQPSRQPTACGLGIDTSDETRKIADETLRAQVRATIARGAVGRQRFCHHTTDCARANSTSEPAQPGNQAVFGAMPQVIQTPFSAYQPGVKLYLTDYDRPTVISASNSLGSGWVNGKDNTAIGGPDTTTGTLAVKSTDESLGVKEVSLQASTRQVGASGYGMPVTDTKITDQIKPQTDACIGDRNSRCPASYTESPRKSLDANRSYTVANLPEGINSFGINARDVVQNVNIGELKPISYDYEPMNAQPTKVDKTPPSASAARGSLTEINGTRGGGRGTRSVQLDVADALSGVASVQLLDDGLLIAQQRVSCTTDCSAVSFDVNLDALAEGMHELSLQVVDEASNVTRQSASTFLIDRTPPDSVSVDGDLVEEQADWARRGGRVGVISAADAASGIDAMGFVDAGGTPIAAVDLPCVPVTLPQRVEGTVDTCTEDVSAQVTVTIDALPTGVQSIRPYATDGAGQTAYGAPIRLMVDHDPPQQPDTIAAVKGQLPDTTVSWSPFKDSGVGEGSYEWSFRRDGGQRSSERTADKPSVSLDGGSIGDTIEFWLTPIDDAGNKGITQRYEMTVRQPDADTANGRSTSAAAVPEPIAGCSVNAEPNGGREYDYRPALREPPDEADRPGYVIRSTVEFQCFPLTPGPKARAAAAAATVSGTIQLLTQKGDDEAVVGSRTATAAVNPTTRLRTLVTDRGPCLAGARTYSIRIKDVVGTAPGVEEFPLRAGGDFSQTELGCNYSAAFRYASGRDGAEPGTVLGRALTAGAPTRLDSDRVPKGFSTDRAGFAAHHIIPAGEGLRELPLTLPARRAQEVAWACNLAPNSSVNGVWLRQSKRLRFGTDGYKDLLDANGRKRLYHPTVHTEGYYRYIAQQVDRFEAGGECTNRQGFFEALRGIRDNVLKRRDLVGTAGFPFTSAGADGA